MLFRSKSTSDAVVSTLSNQTDFAVSFMGDVDKYSKDEKNKLYMLGITGNKTINGVAPLITQGFAKNLEYMSSPAQQLVSTTWSDEKFNEIRAIILKASRTKQAREAYAVDFCQPLIDIGDDKVASWHNFRSEEHTSELQSH